MNLGEFENWIPLKLVPGEVESVAPFTNVNELSMNSIKQTETEDFTLLFHICFWKIISPEFINIHQLITSWIDFQGKSKVQRWMSF